MSRLDGSWWGSSNRMGLVNGMNQSALAGACVGFRGQGGMAYKVLSDGWRFLLGISTLSGLLCARGGPSARDFWSMLSKVYRHDPGWGQRWKSCGLWFHDGMVHIGHRFLSHQLILITIASPFSSDLFSTRIYWVNESSSRGHRHYDCAFHRHYDYLSLKCMQHFVNLCRTVKAWKDSDQSADLTWMDCVRR